MGMFTKDIATLDDLLTQGLQTIYYAEGQILTALPKMIDQATSPELKQGFQQHLAETETQRQRLEQVFAAMGKEAHESTCPAIDGIVKAANSTAADISDPEVLDAALAYGAQMVEHYEIAQYGTLIAWATELGRADVASILAESLAEEKATDERLTRIAEARINQKAAGTDGAATSDVASASFQNA